ncbi:MAG: TfoX/Sxy family protein [bacterium]
MTPETILSTTLGHISGLKSRSMFGGYGLYKDGIIVGMIVDGILYFKVGDTNRTDYEELGAKPFTYMHKDKGPVAMSYWEVPGSVQADPKLVEVWLEKSFAISLAKKKLVAK